MATIMFIDDDDQMRILGKIDLEEAGYRFVGAANGKQALLEHQKVDVILVDIFMPHMDGLELIPALRRTRPTAKIIAMTAGEGVRNYLDAAKHLGAHDTLKKPFTRQELLDVVASQLK